jgi:formylglycine-generating enzyme required for sulfatase activity
MPDIDGQTTAKPIAPSDDYVHDSEYLLNELKRLFQQEFTTPLNLNSAVRTEEVTIQFENNSQADTDLRNVRPGDGTVTFESGRFTVETTATATFRSSPFIRDRPVAVMIEPFAGGSDVTSQEGIVNINEGF